MGFLWLVGDLHGDLSKARDALQIAGVLSSDGKDQWVGEDTVCPFFSSLTNIDLEHNFSFCCILVQRLRPSLNRDVYEMNDNYACLDSNLL